MTTKNQCSKTADRATKARRVRECKAVSPAVAAYHRLSFVRAREGKFWELPMPAEDAIAAACRNDDGTRNDRDAALYILGCRQGTSAALEYLEFLRAYPGSYSGGRMQRFVLSMIECERDGLLRGQVVGFFSTIDYALHCTACREQGRAGPV